MAFNALHSVTNKNELECICRKWHIHRWNRLLYALLIKYLGVPADLLPFSTSLCPDKLMQEIWESGNFGHGDERYGERPTGKWANKRYTLKRIFHKMHLSLGYAFDETFWWLAGLALLRFKEMIKRNERIAEKIFAEAHTGESEQYMSVRMESFQMGYAGNRRIPLAHHLLYLSGIFGVVMSLVNVAMSKWIIDVATGAQEGNIYLVATIVALSFLLGMGIKLVSPWILARSTCASVSACKIRCPTP